MKNIVLQEKLVETLQYVKYGIMNTRYNLNLPNRIFFENDVDKKNKTVFISSPDYPGLYTIAPLDNQEEIINLVNDAIFTYFDVPTYIAKRTPNKFFPNESLDRSKVSFVYPQGIAVA